MSSIHERLFNTLNNEFADLLKDDPEFPYDGIKVKLNSGVDLNIIYPANDEYMFSWEKDGISYRIDTAPIHKELKTFPNHFHSGEAIEDDKITEPSKKPEENLKRVLEFISK